MRRVRREAPAIAAGLLLASPVAVGGAYSALASLGVVGPGARGLSLDAVASVMASADTWESVVWTLGVAGCATVIAAAAAAGAAVQLRQSRIGQLVSVSPMAIPHVAAALATLLMFGQSGFLSRLAYLAGLTAGPASFPALVYDRAGVSLMIVFVWKEFPYLLLTALAILSARAEPLEEVARTLGASGRQAFWRVTWPLLWRGTAPAVLAAFAFLIGQYEMPALLAPSDPLPLSLLTYERSVDPVLARRGEAHVLGLIALALSGLVVAMHARWTAGPGESES